MKKILLFLFFVASIKASGQGINDEKVTLVNFLKRMYAAEPFEGVKIIDDYDHQYIVSVIVLDVAKYKSESTMTRVAQVKAQAQASAFFNGSTITQEVIISTKETTDSNNNMVTIIETVEKIKQNSVGFCQGLELLTNFDGVDSGKRVFVYIRELKEEE
jgi:hypothetical protein